MSQQESGFTVVEVVVALVIAGFLLLGAHQVYSVVLLSSKDGRAMAYASSLAYDAMRRHENDVTTPCAPSTVTEAVADNTEIGSGASIKIEITCPYVSTFPDISKISSTITYGTPQKTVSHAIFTN